MRAALAHYARALRQASAGRAAPMEFIDGAGDALMWMDASQWVAGLRPGDVSIVDACGGPTLDVGCGPGRLVSALARRGLPALGIDVSLEAVRQANTRGAAVIRCDVFGDVPASGLWRHVLLADGNIGIGGDPVRLLRRCSALAAGDATLIVEAGAPGSGSWRRQVRLRHAGHTSSVFWWAAVAVDDLHSTASAAGLLTSRVWTEGRRWFASLRARA